MNSFNLTNVKHTFKKKCLRFFRTVKKGTLIIDSSTIDPSVAKDVAAQADKKGAVYLDAPVSGGK